MSRLATRLTCLLVLSAFLAGCGSEGSPNSASSTPDPAKATEAAGQLKGTALPAKN